MFSTFDEIYCDARAEDWRMINGKPVTIGWLWGYIYGSQKRQDEPFEPGTMAWYDWDEGYREAVFTFIN
jgi:hypothetical protein